MMKCNCGREAKYSLKEGYSCNKRSVCLTYAELMSEKNKLQSALNNAVESGKDVVFFRESTPQYIQAENELRRIDKQHCNQSHFGNM